MLTFFVRLWQNLAYHWKHRNDVYVTVKDEWLK